MARVQQPVRGDAGFAAILTPYPSVPLHARREPPHPSLPPVAANKAASAILRLPPSKLHLSALLPNANPPRSLPPGERPRPSQEEHGFANALRLW